MTSKYETPETGALAFRLSGRRGESRSASNNGDSRVSVSVRELERMASSLRLAGDARNTERIDLEILALLEKKIYRKIMVQSRRQRVLAREATA
ncbi:MAG: hypothetical protein PVI92_10530 [Chromatiales bacterium]|jgi:hypothetical protein